MSNQDGAFPSRRAPELGADHVRRRHRPGDRGGPTTSISPRTPSPRRFAAARSEEHSNRSVPLDADTVRGAHAIAPEVEETYGELTGERLFPEPEVRTGFASRLIAALERRDA